MRVVRPAAAGVLLIAGLAATCLVAETSLRWFLGEPALRGVLLPASRFETLRHARGISGPLTIASGVVLGASVLSLALGLDGWDDRCRRVAWAGCWWVGVLMGPLAVAVAGMRSELAGALMTVGISGWLAELWLAARPPVPAQAAVSPWWCHSAVAVYVAVFSTMSIAQDAALNVPHGDTAMYEEHLWNLTHGKGFRSQLDSGRSFLGEHVQVIHVFLTPIYLAWPTLSLLNLCQTLALASGAWGVRRLAVTDGLPPAAGAALAIAYLLYFPLQSLNLEASWKTFRPESFGVPLTLFGLADLSAHRYARGLSLLALTLLVKEEYGLILMMVGIWLACRRQRGPLGRWEVGLGVAVTVAGLAALIISVSLVIPYFRGGAPHYLPYFRGLGETPRQMVVHVLTHPTETWARLATAENAAFLLLLLGPLALAPLASPLRLLVGAPIAGYLMLGDFPPLRQPWFHFHAPLVGVWWWAAVGGVATLGRWIDPTRLSRSIVCLCLVTGLWHGRSPLSWRFHDPFAGVPRGLVNGTEQFSPEGAYWRDVYLPTERSRAFPAAFAHTRPTDRIMATDYVRPRFTHFAECHDYPNVRPHVDVASIDAVILDKTEGWWGRGETNPDRALLALLDDPRTPAGVTVPIRGVAFTVVHHDPYFLVARRVDSPTDAGNLPGK